MSELGWKCWGRSERETDPSLCPARKLEFQRGEEGDREVSLADCSKPARDNEELDLGQRPGDGKGGTVRSWKLEASGLEDRDHSHGMVVQCCNTPSSVRRGPLRERG